MFKFVNNLSQDLKAKADAKIHTFASHLRRVLWKAVLILAIPMAGWLYHEHKAAEAISEAVAEAEARAYGQFGVEVFTLATVFVGEAKGQPKEWLDIASAFFARVDDPRWANTVERVAKERCEIDALCDRVPEYLTSEVGQQAILFAREVLTAYYTGTFVPTHPGHSWATPKAAEGHAYFEGLEVVAQGTGHQYFADAPMRPKPNPQRCGEQSLAPCTSIRPKPRPTVLSPETEQFFGDEIDAAVALALAEATE